MKFHKYHALGNDYIVVDPTENNHILPDIAWIKAFCDRHTGIGSDGVLYGPTKEEPTALRIFNPDGSEAEKSGNGLRIFARYLFEKKNMGNSFTIQLPNESIGIEVLEKNGNLVKVEMGTPSFDTDHIGMKVEGAFIQSILEVGNQEVVGTAISMGNPHFVVPTETDLEKQAKTLGPLIEHHAIFRNRTNVQFARKVNENTVEAFIWERGAGYTLASGSSSCAVASVFYKLKEVESPVTVRMPGGELIIEIEGDLEKVWMTGEVKAVFEGIWKS